MENKNNNIVDSTVNDSQTENKNNSVDSTCNGDLEAKQTNDDQIDGVHSSSTAAASSPVALYRSSLLMRQYYDMINQLVQYLNGAAEELEALRRENHCLRAVNNDFKNKSEREGAVNVEKFILPKNISVSSKGYLIEDGSSSSSPATLVQKYEDLKELLNLCLTSLREAAKESDKLRQENESLRLGSINSESELNKKLNTLTEASVENHFAPAPFKSLEMMIQAEAASGKTRGSTRIGNASQLRAGARMQIKNPEMSIKSGGKSFFVLNGIMATVAFMSSVLSLYLFFYKPCPTDEQVQKYHEELRQCKHEVSEYKQEVFEYKQEVGEFIRTILAGSGLQAQNSHRVPQERPTTSLFQSVFSLMNDNEN